MARQTSSYPGALDVFTHATTDFNPGDAVPSTDFERLVDAIKKIETELGIDPAGVSVDLVTRLASVTVAQFTALGALVEWTDWTPTLTGDADLSGYTSARYYRIGDICFFSFTADSKNVTTAGTIQITLPFTHANTSYNAVVNLVNDGSSTVGMVFGIIDPNVNYIKLSKTATGGSWAGTETEVYLRINGFFEIA